MRHDQRIHDRAAVRVDDHRVQVDLGNGRRSRGHERGEARGDAAEFIQGERPAVTAAPEQRRDPQRDTSRAASAASKGGSA